MTCTLQVGPPFSVKTSVLLMTLPPFWIHWKAWSELTKSSVVAIEGELPCTGNVTVAGFGTGQVKESTVHAGFGKVPAAQLWAE